MSASSNDNSLILKGIQEKLSMEQNIIVSRSTICRRLKSLNLTRKGLKNDRISTHRKGRLKDKFFHQIRD